MLGEQFRMGRRMNPSEPELFRLAYDHAIDTFRDMDDGSYWQSSLLFDFGWGKEPGYYKLLLPSISGLVELLLTAKAEDDYFGAASILLDEFADEALPLLEMALQNEARYPRAAQRMKAVGLDRAVNRSNIIGKSTEQVQADFARWQALADAIISKTKREKTNWWSRLFHKKL
ncbi:MAG: hypothetical protein VB061_06415 [Christensenella sp.]|nr:hypothetical protein [Christensenella sp.]